MSLTLGAVAKLAFAVSRTTRSRWSRSAGAVELRAGAAAAVKRPPVATAAALPSPGPPFLPPRRGAEVAAAPTPARFRSDRLSATRPPTHAAPAYLHRKHDTWQRARSRW